MNSENFQKVVLEELRALREGQTKLEEGQSKLEQGQAKLEQGQAKLEQSQAKLEQGQAKLEEGQARIERKLDDMEVKNANRHLEIESKLNALIEDNKSIYEILGEHEVAIRTLRRKPV